MKETHLLLQRLLDSFEKKSHAVSDSLLPPYSDENLSQECKWFPSELPESIFNLYSWKGGQTKDAWEEEYPFWFRDMSFISPALAKLEYESMIQCYGIDNTLEEDGLILKNSFPFAAFNGGWFVVPSGSHRWLNRYQEPIICVFEGITLYYHSLDSMLKTCIEVVNHRSWSSEESDIDEDIEQKIWQKYNPGVFQD